MRFSLEGTLVPVGGGKQADRRQDGLRDAAPQRNSRVIIQLDV